MAEAGHSAKGQYSDSEHYALYQQVLTRGRSIIHRRYALSVFRERAIEASSTNDQDDD